MTQGGADPVGELPALGFGLLLVVIRAGAACMVLPGSGEAEVPPTVRAGFALTLAVLLTPVLGPALPPPTGSVWLLLGQVGGELLAGLFLGWLARLATLALPLAGQIVATLIGHSNVLQPDSVLGSQGTAIGRLMSLAVPVLVLSTGLHGYALSAIAGSYRAIPVGALLAPGDAVQLIVGGVGDLCALALRLAAPFVLVGIVWNVALAVLSRLVPQVQVFFLAPPAQVLGGLALLGLLGGALLEVWREQAQFAFAILPGL